MRVGEKEKLQQISFIYESPKVEEKVTFVTRGSRMQVTLTRFVATALLVILITTTIVWFNLKQTPSEEKAIDIVLHHKPAINEKEGSLRSKPSISHHLPQTGRGKPDTTTNDDTQVCMYCFY